VTIYNEPGALVWNDAAVDDPDAAQAFYGAVFDYRFDPMEGMEGYATFATGGSPLGGIYALEPGTPRGWMTCFSVASTDSAVAAAEKAGGKITMAPQDTEFGRFAALSLG